MGYTHYWDHKGFTDKQWMELVRFTRNLISNTKTPIVGGAGHAGSYPVTNELAITFNGEEDDSCETFHLTKSPQDFEFCKTRQLPYDATVVAVMREAMEINPTFNPRSDGGWAVFGTKD